MNEEDQNALKSKNLNYFKQSMRSLYDRLSQHTPSTELVFSDDGEPDVVFNGQYFYNKNFNEFHDKQMDNFLRAQDRRFVLFPPAPDTLDEYSGKFLDGILTTATREGIEFNVHHTEDRSFFLLVFGVGLAKHIERLVENTECKVLLIIDPNIEFLYQSLHTFDWEKLFDKMAKNNGVVKFLFLNSPESIAFNIRAEVRLACPCAIDGLTIYFHYSSPFFIGIMNILKADRNLILSGLGFMYDELIMMKNAHHNFYSGNSRVFLRPNDQFLDIPVFVVGSGPSLDESIPFLKENADKAVIISSGSALRPLMNRGIVPDFQIEIENIKVLPVTSQVAEEHDISSICLVTASTVEQTILKYFDNILFYFRASLSPYPMYCESDHYCLVNPGPTVVNASLSFAQELGFRTIYFFGTDMGTKDASQHHSKEAYQYTEGAIHTLRDFNLPVQSNFGGKCYTFTDLYWTRDCIVNAIKLFKRGRTYYNCSDGAFIAGAIPHLASSISLPELKGGKESLVMKLIEDFPIYTKEKFEENWNDEKFVGYLNDFIDEVLKVFNESPSLLNHDYLINLMKLLNPVEEPRTRISMALLFNGTIFQMLLALEYYLNRAPEKKSALRIEEIAREGFVETLEVLRKVATEELGRLTELADAGAYDEPPN